MNSINKGKHLSEFDRVIIEEGLKYNNSLKDIAQRIGKDPTTISKEIKRNRTFRSSSYAFKGGCIHRRSCTVKQLCSDGCNRQCKSCIDQNCQRICPDFETKSCKKLEKFPHVCNGCESKVTCKLDKYDYRHKIAEASYRDSLESSREGLRLTKVELAFIDNLVSPLIENGQPLSHIYNTHEDAIPCSERTLYNLIDKGHLRVRNIDLRRKVTYKPRKKQKSKDTKGTHRIGRSYKDFNEATSKQPALEVVEMDTVIGRKGGKVLLTLLFRKSNTMFVKLLDRNTQKCVIKAFNEISDEIGLDLFRKNFPLIITDNGSEFLNYKALEYDKKGNLRTNIFYCDPMSSFQKPHIEKNHEFIRYILPKGSSFDNYTQDQINKMMNHINSVSRKKLNNKTPIEIAKDTLDPKLLAVFDAKEIAPDKVILKEELINPGKIKRTLLEGLK